MTTIPFVPNPTTAPPFSTTVTLDGASYTLSTTWNVYRGDWYMGLTDQSGNLLIFQPLIGSPDSANIYLAPGLFKTSTLLYRVSTGNFEIGP